MITVKLNHSTIVELMAILNDLRDSGYKQGKDFDFSFYKQEWSGSVMTPKHTVFTFHSGRLASWFALKYS